MKAGCIQLSHQPNAPHNSSSAQSKHQPNKPDNPQQPSDLRCPSHRRLRSVCASQIRRHSCRREDNIRTLRSRQRVWGGKAGTWTRTERPRKRIEPILTGVCGTAIITLQDQRPSATSHHGEENERTQSSQACPLRRLRARAPRHPYQSTTAATHQPSFSSQKRRRT